MFSVCASPCWAAVAVARDHCRGFDQVAALWILQHLLLSFCLSSTVQHSVGQPSSTRYTAHSLLKPPSSGYKVTLLRVPYSSEQPWVLNTYAQKSKPMLVLLSYNHYCILDKTHDNIYSKWSQFSRWRAGRRVTALRLRRRFGRSMTVEVCNPKSGLVVHTRKPQLEGSYTGVSLRGYFNQFTVCLPVYCQTFILTVIRSEPLELFRVKWDRKMLKRHSPFPQVFEHLLIMGLHTYTGSCFVSVSNPDFNRTRPCLGKIVDPAIYKIRT